MNVIKSLSMIAACCVVAGAASADVYKCYTLTPEQMALGFYKDPQYHEKALALESSSKQCAMMAHESMDKDVKHMSSQQSKLFGEQAMDCKSAAKHHNTETQASDAVSPVTPGDGSSSTSSQLSNTGSLTPTVGTHAEKCNAAYKEMRDAAPATPEAQKASDAKMMH